MKNKLIEILETYIDKLPALQRNLIKTFIPSLKSRINGMTDDEITEMILEIKNIIDNILIQE